LGPGFPWMNTEGRGIFIDPELAIRAIGEANLSTEPLYMAATDVWDSRSGFEPRAPATFRAPRQEYIRAASERMAPCIAAARAAEPPASSDLPRLLPELFNTLVAALTPSVRRRINAKLALVIEGPHGGEWTVDFTAPGPEYVREKVLADWTYKIAVEDRLIAPFISGEQPFFEDLLLSLRF